MTEHDFLLAIILVLAVLCLWLVWSVAFLDGQYDNLRQLYAELRGAYDRRLAEIHDLEDRLAVSASKERRDPLSAWREWAEGDDD